MYAAFTALVPKVGNGGRDAPEETTGRLCRALVFAPERRKCAAPHLFDFLLSNGVGNHSNSTCQCPDAPGPGSGPGKQKSLREPLHPSFRTLTSMPHADCTPWLRPHVGRIIDLWNASAAGTRPVTPQFRLAEQRKREKAYDEAVHSVEKELRTAPRTRSARLVTQDRIVAVFGRFATTALGLDDNEVHRITHDFLPVGTNLARWARRFDPTMSKTDIVQACRNAWTACGLQPLFGQPTQLTPSILAYSLMYPYTDNYIDRADIPPQAKSDFSARFRERLRGESPPPENQREA